MIEVTTKDNSDVIEATVDCTGTRVRLHVNSDCYYLLPEEAREIVRQLTDAADWIEGTPPAASRTVLPVLTIEDLLAQRRTA